MIDWKTVNLERSRLKEMNKDEVYEKYLESPKHKGFSYSWKSLPKLKWTQYIDARLFNRMDVELIADHFYRLGIKHGKRGMYGEENKSEDKRVKGKEL